MVRLKSDHVEIIADLGFQICLQKLCYSSVHTMSCQPDAPKITANFEGKFETLSRGKRTKEKEKPFGFHHKYWWEKCMKQTVEALSFANCVCAQNFPLQMETNSEWEAKTRENKTQRLDQWKLYGWNVQKRIRGWHKRILHRKYKICLSENRKDVSIDYPG